MIAFSTWSTMVVGLNPALQKRFILSSSTPTLQPGQVHRADCIHEGIGGKGQDVAVALSCLYKSHTPETILLAQFLGFGAEGDILQKLLQQQLLGQWRDSWTVRTKSKLRTCTTIVSQTEATELVEPSGMIDGGEMNQLMEHWTDPDRYGSSTVSGLCFMGSLPPGCPSTTYATLYHELLTKSIPRAEPICCVVDTVIGLGPLLNSMAFHRTQGEKNWTQSLNMIKINRMELFHLTQQQGADVHGDFLSVQQLQDMVEALHRIFSTSAQAIDSIAITHGKAASYLVSCHPANVTPVFYEYKIPNLNQLYPQQVKVYPIGGGDAVAAGTVAAWQYLKHKTIKHPALKDTIQTSLDCLQMNKHWDDDVVAFAFGLACGSASCLKEQNSVLDTEDALGIMNEIHIQRLN